MSIACDEIFTVFVFAEIYMDMVSDIRVVWTVQAVS